MATEKGSHSSLSVLVVEDHADTADSLAMLLRCYDYQVQVVRDGVAALEAVQARRPDVVLLDMGLPRLDGYRVAEQLRRQWGPDLLLVAITGYGGEVDVQRALASGIDHHFVKPADPEEFCALLTRAAWRLSRRAMSPANGQGDAALPPSDTAIAS
jgi:CheY-like chemotaxis protein